jgi:hypothetical protein
MLALVYSNVGHYRSYRLCSVERRVTSALLKRSERYQLSLRCGVASFSVEKCSILTAM